ncbi:hypothetical protein [Ekhidna sp.]|uniref:hypothetical protein n=1 Tax=Ekhidna sp. TaxID=2608089 RepID=UPI003CCB8EBA
MKYAKQLYLAIIVICVIIIAWSTYYTLGGFDPVEVFVMEGRERTVIGREYIEKFPNADFPARMEANRAAIDSGKLKGMFTLVFFENDTIGQDSIHYFLGASVDEISDVLRLPAGYTYKEFRTNKIFKVFMTRHWLVRPNREEVAELVEIKAIEEGEVLLPFWFEMYYQDESMSVEYWAK